VVLGELAAQVAEPIEAVAAQVEKEVKAHVI
jgi:hypothetical protein